MLFKISLICFTILFLGDPKMNSVTLLMTGLRILLAKCVTVNVLMSVKAFIV